ncbi:MAG: ATP-binding protein [bacterium]
MDKNTLFETLVRWNYWGKRSLQRLQVRQLMDDMLPFVEEPYPLVLIGIRRSGKSSLLTLLMQHLLDNGVAPRQLFLVNFEEPLFGVHLSIDFFEALIALYRERVNPEQKIYFFLDEIQNLPEWEKWVRREADLKEHKIFLTGSSAKLLSSEIATLLTGRHYTFKVAPLSFEEFLSWQGIPYETEVEQAENKAVIRKSLSNYLQWGGFPEVVLTDDDKRDKILHQYFDDILFRDVVLRYQIRDVRLLQGIAEYYMSNMAALHSFNRLKGVFGTSLDNVRRYTAFLEDAQLIFSLNKFSYKLSERQKVSRKVYVVDTGLRNAISFRFSQDLGRLIENVVAQKLFNQSQELYYFGNGSECDFVSRQQAKFLPIQVSYSDLSDEKLKAREFRGLLAALKHLKQNRGLLLTDDVEDVQHLEGLHIRLQPVWKFLLEK